MPSSNEHLHYIGLEHIEQQTLRLSGIGKSSDVTSNKFRFKAGDVLFGKLRPYFRKVYRPKFDGVCSTDIWVVRAKEKFDQGFLFYFMSSEDFIDLSNQSSGGTRMPRADWNNLKDIEWEFPDLPTQTRIASILSALDDKIELNRRTNHTLEQMAQTLFKKYFVTDIDPDNLPEGWRWGKLGEIIDVKGGTTPSTSIKEYWNGQLHWTSPKDLSNLSFPVLLTTEKRITEAGLKKVSSGLLPVGTLLLSSRAPIGYLAITQIPVAINQGYIAILSEKGYSNYFMLYWLKQNMDIIIQNSNGSTFLEISKSVFRSIDLAIPPVSLVKSFDNLVSDMFARIISNEKENIQLSKIRDSLLPKLMSGEITVN